VVAVAGPTILFFVSSCEMLGTNRRSAETVWERIKTVYFHQGLAVGAVVTTKADGTLEEERRYEPYGHPIEANVGGTIGPVDFQREQQNSLGKLTSPNTGWSYHGIRWMQPQTGRWTSPDPNVRDPSTERVLAPWTLNPYQYANSNPLLFHDPNGAASEFTAQQIKDLALQYKGKADTNCLSAFKAGGQGLYGDSFKSPKSDDTINKVVDRLGARAVPVKEASSVKFNIDRSGDDKLANYRDKSPTASSIISDKMAGKQQFGVFALAPDMGYHSITVVAEKKDGKVTTYWFDQNTRRAVSAKELDEKVLHYTQMGLDTPTRSGGERGLQLEMWELVPDPSKASDTKTGSNKSTSHDKIETTPMDEDR